MIYVTEPESTNGVGSLGVRLLVASLQAKGHLVKKVHLVSVKGITEPTELTPTYVKTSMNWLDKPSAWFISVLYVRQYEALSTMFSRMELPMLASHRRDTDPLIVFGGQFANAPEPIAEFADVIALGDGEVSYLTEVHEAIKVRGISNTSQDARLAQFMKYLRSHDEPLSTFPAFGIEGMSARLRYALNKPVGETELIESLRELKSRGVSRVKLYMLANLPGEGPSDYTAFEKFCCQAIHLDMHFLVTVTPFCSVPHTPFERIGGTFCPLYLQSLKKVISEQRLFGKLKMLIYGANRSRERSEMDVVFSRGDRTMTKYFLNAHNPKVRKAWRKWTNAEYWLQAFPWDHPMPWDHVDVGIRKDLKRRACTTYFERLRRAPDECIRTGF